MPGKGADFEKDLAPIALIGSIPNILVVTPSLGVNDVKGLIALAKEKPGRKPMKEVKTMREDAAAVEKMGDEIKARYVKIFKV